MKRALFSMTEKELKTMLRKHQRWLECRIKGERFYLKDVDLRRIDLSNADLRGAVLSNVNLIGANLRNANLRGANLIGSNLRSADLSTANLISANFYKANLSNADMSFTILTGADLACANLKGTILTGSSLHGANIPVKEAYRLGTILKRKRIGYKRLQNGVICKLEIPKGAIVFSINGSKYRTNIAKVLEGEGYSRWDPMFVYKKGKTLKIENFSLEYNVECGPGIHFFKTKEEAKKL